MMKRVTVLLIFISAWILHSEACRSEGSNESNPRPVTMIPGGTMSTTPCTPTQQCTRFDDVFNGPVLITAACAPFLNGSCIYVDQTLRNIFTEMHESTLRNISSQISESCDCRNRSTEILCRYLFPECSFFDGNECIEPTCETPTIMQPCTGYCNRFLNSCISDEIGNLLNKLFTDSNSTNINVTIDSICSNLRSEACWNGTNLDELVSRDVCLAYPVQTTFLPQATTVLPPASTENSQFTISSTSINTNASQTELSYQSNIIIIVCSIGALIVVAGIGILVRFRGRINAFKPKSSSLRVNENIYETHSSEQTHVNATTESNNEYLCARDIENIELVAMPNNPGNETTSIERNYENSYHSIADPSSDNQYEIADFSADTEKLSSTQEFNGYVEMSSIRKNNVAHNATKSFVSRQSNDVTNGEGSEYEIMN